MTEKLFQIGVIRSFEVREERSTQPIFKLWEGVYEIPKSVVYEIPIAKMWVNEGWLRETLLDADFNKSPTREVSVTEFKKRQVKAWLDGDIDPPWDLVQVPHEVLYEGMRVIVGRGALSDRQTIFTDIATTRLQAADDRACEILGHLVRAPDMWGDPFSVEMQYLTTLDILINLRGLASEDPKKGVGRRWCGVIHENGYRSNLPLAHQTEGFDVLVKLLPKLRACVLDPNEPDRTCERCGQDIDDEPEEVIICSTCIGERDLRMWSSLDLAKWGSLQTPKETPE